MKHILTLIVTTFCLPMVLTGCASTPPSNFYILSPLTTDTETGNPGTVVGGLAIGVGPVTFAEYLEQPTMITRTGSNQIERHEFNRWAGSLKDNFSRTLGENLSNLLATDRIAHFPWKRSIPVDYGVAVDVSRFDGALGGNVTLNASWTISAEHGEKTLLTRKTSYRESTETEDYAALVAAQSRALAAFSRDVAAAIGKLSQRSALR